MSVWLYVIIGVVAFIVAVLGIFAVVLWRTKMTPAEGAAYLRELGIDLAKLPGRLWRISNDPPTPRRAKLWLLGLALYVLSPIDPIPDFIPVVGLLDEIILVPLVLRHVRRMIPDDVWDEHFGATR
ncbi:MAG: YkvA family protein [Thermomicrobiales bacterium]